MKKALILFICIALVFGAAACNSGNKANNSNNNIATPAQSSDSIAGDTTAPAETTTEKLLPDLPDGLDFGGYNFKTLYSSIAEAGVWGLRDIVAESENGEPINDAVYLRNTYLEDKYNFKITGTPTTTTSMTSASMKKFILAGSDDFDALFVRQNQTADLITSGCLADLKTVPYLDLTKPWWDQSIIDQLSVCNKDFAASGDIMSTNNNALRVIMFNKSMIADQGFDDPYALVRNNKWTLDSLYSMCKNVSKDVNGDGKMDENDQYGYLVQSGITINMYYAANQQVMTKDSGGVPSVQIGSDQNITVLQKINDILLAKDAVMFDQDFKSVNPSHPEYVLQDVFEAKRGLFYAEVLQLAERMRATDTDFGIIPPPKADENQTNYMSFADSWCMNLMLIPVTNTNLERTGEILEAMCAESKYGLLPAYYDLTLKGKYSRDNDSEQMLDIIIANKVVSQDEMFGWGMTSALQAELVKRTGNFVSVIDQNTSKVQTKMDKSVTKIEALG